MGDIHAMRLVGGHRALDFVNTLGGRKDTPDDEYLHHYDHLLAWSERAGLIDSERAGALAGHARRRPQPAAATLTGALELRNHLDAILRAIVAGGPPPAPALDAIRRAEVNALDHATLTEDFAWTWTTVALECPLWPIAHAAVDLLGNSPLDRLGECEHCRWLFLDTTRNHSRRWCSMDACGAVEKMRRHRAKP
jgi:predicted RNA-binding Zn ribbon-like protein